MFEKLKTFWTIYISTLRAKARELKAMIKQYNEEKTNEQHDN